MLNFSDGVKKWSVLVPTAPLPEFWRVASRRNLLARLELAKAERTDLLIIGHPKSGNTWLRTMISRVYQVRHGLPASVIITSDELARRHPGVPRVSATNGYYSYEGVVGEKLAAGAPDCGLRQKAIVMLARNPCDIAVSWYFQFTKRQSAHKQELINHFIAHPIDRRTISMWDFVRYSDIGLPFLIDYLNGWERNIQYLENGFLVRYEDLRRQPSETLKRVISTIDQTFSVEEIEEAVRFGSFNHLQQLEARGFFRQGGLRRRDPDDPNASKVRRGKIGGYRDYFTPEQVSELEALMAERLSPTLGYRSGEVAHHVGEPDGQWGFGSE
jgi:hypothetical protein